MCTPKLSIRICACLRRTSKASYLHFLSAWYFLFQLKRALREKLKFSQIVKNFHAFYGIWKFITAFTIAHHLFLSWKIRAYLVRGLSELFATWYFLSRGLNRTSPKPLGEGPTLVGCPRLIIYYIRSILRPFFYLQPEDTPCSGDRGHLSQFFQRDWI